MSVWSTIDISRQSAEDYVRRIRAKSAVDPVKLLSDAELDKELHEYVYSERHTDVLGVCYNFNILS